MPQPSVDDQILARVLQAWRAAVEAEQTVMGALEWSSTPAGINAFMEATKVVCPELWAQEAKDA